MDWKITFRSIIVDADNREEALEKALEEIRCGKYEEEIEQLTD